MSEKRGQESSDNERQILTEVLQEHARKRMESPEHQARLREITRKFTDGMLKEFHAALELAAERAKYDGGASIRALLRAYKPPSK